ncbi:hypothetical protein BpHYR1_046411 [Brachionus plicatilis]|uniref:Uncharacterized protein n=1 Tax=Brachionus plicatilis TaxID=10195 RepID=A0A3M7RHB7_BRAPC|nr:hypothetical protein BpHYR1_046411 [Brachionus plicatilis]
MFVCLIGLNGMFLVYVVSGPVAVSVQTNHFEKRSDLCWHGWRVSIPLFIELYLLTFSSLLLSLEKINFFEAPFGANNVAKKF